MIFYSKRNEVRLICSDKGQFVRKVFSDRKSFCKELDHYRKMKDRIPIPVLYQEEECVLELEYIPCPSLLDILEQQESSCFSPEPWTALGQWILLCSECCALVPGDGNLRNFLWDSAAGRCIGIDFEEYCDGTPEEAGARLIAFLLEYDPKGTPVKAAAAERLQTILHSSQEQIDLIRSDLQARRSAQARGKRK